MFGALFLDRRDTAIMRIFIDTGIRVSGLAGLRYDPDEEDKNDVFLTQRRPYPSQGRRRDLGTDRQEGRSIPRQVHSGARGTPRRRLRGSGSASRGTTRRG